MIYKHPNKANFYCPISYKQIQLIAMNETQGWSRHKYTNCVWQHWGLPVVLLATARQLAMLAFATWRIRNSKKVWRDLAKIVKISENNRHWWVHKILSMVLSVAKFYEIQTAGQNKEGHPISPLKTNCCSLFGHCDLLIPFNFDLDNNYADSVHSVVMKKWLSLLEKN